MIDFSIMYNCTSSTSSVVFQIEHENNLLNIGTVQQSKQYVSYFKNYIWKHFVFQIQVLLLYLLKNALYRLISTVLLRIIKSVLWNILYF